MGLYCIRPMVGVSRKHLRAAAQLLQIVGTLRSNTLVSSILMLAGNLGMSLTLDYVFYGTFSLLRAAGIFLILAGMALVEKEKTAEAQTAAEEK